MLEGTGSLDKILTKINVKRPKFRSPNNDKRPPQLSRFLCRGIYSHRTQVSWRVFVAAIVVAYNFWPGSSCVFPLKVCVSDGFKPCHHQSHIRHSPWPAICLHPILGTVWGPPTNTVYTPPCPFHVRKLRNRLRRGVCHFYPLMAVTPYFTNVDLLTVGCFSSSKWETRAPLKHLSGSVKCPLSVQWGSLKSTSPIIQISTVWG